MLKVNITLSTFCDLVRRIEIRPLGCSVGLFPLSSIVHVTVRAVKSRFSLSLVDFFGAVQSENFFVIVCIASKNLYFIKNKLPCFLCFFSFRQYITDIFKSLRPNGLFTLQVISSVLDSGVRDSKVCDSDGRKRFVCTSQSLTAKLCCIVFFFGFI